MLKVSKRSDFHSFFNLDYSFRETFQTTQMAKLRNHFRRFLCGNSNNVVSSFKTNCFACLTFDAFQ